MKIFYILSIILLTSVEAKTQSNRIIQPSDPVVKFYPNPAISQITFDFENGYDRSFSFQIFSFIGKKVFEQNNLQPRTVVNLADFFRGVYIFQIRDKNGKIVESGKFQVAK
jgi:Secretion system C-terminal sorting domain